MRYLMMIVGDANRCDAAGRVGGTGTATSAAVSCCVLRLLLTRQEHVNIVHVHAAGCIAGNLSIGPCLVYHFSADATRLHHNDYQPHGA